MNQIDVWDEMVTSGDHFGVGVKTRKPPFASLTCKPFIFRMLKRGGMITFGDRGGGSQNKKAFVRFAHSRAFLFSGCSSEALGHPENKKARSAGGGKGFLVLVGVR